MIQVSLPWIPMLVVGSRAKGQLRINSVIQVSLPRILMLAVGSRAKRQLRFLTLPLKLGIIDLSFPSWIGVVSGKAIFGPPLEEYWTKKLEEEAGKGASDAGNS
ncbi:hypothetical protein M5K25_014913 [Dendrobium thyrsiflorum]|uniref:Uncharacterized protein n=1 Tax=Dendrobium thyrsiflorum TaxID=117978 RepID=A0ABD0UVW9_DENTH